MGFPARARCQLARKSRQCENSNAALATHCGDRFKIAVSILKTVAPSLLSGSTERYAIFVSSLICRAAVCLALQLSGRQQHKIVSAQSVG